ncbi:MAG: Zn-dependent hydrolase [Clostridia bacterium]|nr:Zn-dependent hydrolase [Clostridia bacterium]
MKKTYVTTVPNHIGTFLQASKCFASLGINITRVSYNKAVDSHTLFIDAEGDPEQLSRADKLLEQIGYLHNTENREPEITLLEFRLKDEPGSVTQILELIQSFNFNISYISSQQNNTDYQLFKVGLLVEDEKSVSRFLEQAQSLCDVRVIEYNHSEKVFDNSIFYNSFVTSLIEASGISESQKNELLINTNLAMQILDEEGRSPYRTFDTISKFADMLASCRGKAFSPRVTTYKIADNTEITVIEPPCGSNTIIINSRGEYLFVDSGYAYYKEEMIELFKKIIPNFDNIKKRIILTHADVDHCGLLPMFDEINVSKKSAECLMLEFEGKDDFREQNHFHKPYVRICKALTDYCPPDPKKLVVFNDGRPQQFGLMWPISFISFGELNFEVYEGKGGHLPGEIILIDYEHHIAFTGDVYINMHGFTSEQKQYNKYAPKLMTSVDTDPKLCAKERSAIMQRLGAGKWLIFGSHGMAKEYNVSTE